MKFISTLLTSSRRCAHAASFVLGEINQSGQVAPESPSQTELPSLLRICQFLLRRKSSHNLKEGQKVAPGSAESFCHLHFISRSRMPTKLDRDRPSPASSFSATLAARPPKGITSSFLIGPIFGRATPEGTALFESEPATGKAQVSVNCEEERDRNIWFCFLARRERALLVHT